MQSKQKKYEWNWDNSKIVKPVEDQDESSSDDEIKEEISVKKKKLSASERREFEREKERLIREREEFFARNATPSTVEQFERLVIARPNSSILWIRFMAYYVENTELEKARATAKRALKTIAARQEQERLNVVYAWLNLESTFGTAESLERVSEDAIQINDPFKVFQHLLALHAEAGRFEKLKETIKQCTHKLSHNMETGPACAAALYKVGLADDAREILMKTKQNVAPSRHVDLEIKFAILEGKHGHREQSCNLFEKIISEHPKRVDIWSVYVDSLVKNGDIKNARQTLARVASTSLPPKKMKVILKKYLNFEETHGTPATISEVKERIMKYVEDTTNK
ncbi:protein RRP5 homolog [Trichogramma pretiosum]|uniref:protein RRP5 homolog n=1 Tax=Trichogramma pretiosum TaxID=7493 RepID=UPI0006C9DE75|nr:protein RRP5 homolog [Trichogramma pretiosum]